ncbi:unnamed protein product [Symbiodinium sp. CCMP2592]|nr:unnamed protein product [Symbiodinium sp. CCMP2592]
MNSTLDSAAAFHARALEIGLPADFLKLLEDGGVTTTGTLAFISPFQVGHSDEKPVIDALQTVVKRDLTQKELFVTRTTRIEEQRRRLNGVHFSSDSEPSYRVTDLVFQQGTDQQLIWLPCQKYTSKAQEIVSSKSDLSISFDNSGNLRLNKKFQDAQCSLTGELQVRQALQRRSLCYDLAQLCAYSVMEAYHEEMFSLLSRPPVPGRMCITMGQVKEADKVLFFKIAEETRGALSVRPDGSKPMELQMANGKGKTGGKQNQGSEVPQPPPAYVLPDGCSSKDPEGVPICFPYNKDGCKFAKDGKRRRLITSGFFAALASDAASRVRGPAVADGGDPLPEGKQAAEGRCFTTGSFDSLCEFVNAEAHPEFMYSTISIFEQLHVGRHRVARFAAFHLTRHHQGLPVSGFTNLHLQSDFDWEPVFAGCARLSSTFAAAGFQVLAIDGPRNKHSPLHQVWTLDLTVRHCQEALVKRLLQSPVSWMWSVLAHFTRQLKSPTLASFFNDLHTVDYAQRMLGGRWTFATASEAEPTVRQSRRAPQLIPEFKEFRDSRPAQGEFRELVRDGGRDGSCSTFGIFHTKQEFTHRALKLDHPFDDAAAIDDSARRNIFDLLTKGLSSVAQKRINATKKVNQMAKELSVEEARFHASLPQHAQEVLKRKRILLWRRLLQETGFPDVSVGELMEGVDLVGKPAKLSLFEWKEVPATSSVQDLLDSSVWRNHALQKSLDVDDSDDLTSKLWECTLQEVEKGFLKGPFQSEEQVRAALGEEAVCCTRRFLVVQGSAENPKFRPIDDFRESGINAHSLDHLRLHDVDFFITLCRFICNAVDEKGVVAVFLRSGEQLRGLCTVSIEALLDSLGWRYSRDSEKDKPFASQFNLLGVQLSLDSLHLGSIALENKPSRVAKLLLVAQQMCASGKLSRAEAMSLQGQLNFMVGFASGRSLKLVCRALSNLVYSNRAWTRDEVKQLGGYLKCCLEALTPKTMCLKGGSRPLVIFTDAAYEQGVATWGLVVLDPDAGRRKVAGGRIPSSLIELWHQDTEDQVIAQAEAFAMVIARDYAATFAKGRRTFFFVDNDSARYCMIRGSSPVRALLALAHAFYASECRDQLVTWIERVPSASNVADLPSRGECAAAAKMVGGRVINIDSIVKIAAQRCSDVSALPWSLLACHFKGPVPAFHFS